MRDPIRIFDYRFSTLIQSGSGQQLCFQLLLLLHAHYCLEPPTENYYSIEYACQRVHENSSQEF